MMKVIMTSLNGSVMRKPRMFLLILLLILASLSLVACKSNVPEGTNNTAEPGALEENNSESENDTDTVESKIIHGVSDPWPPFIYETLPPTGLTIEITTAVFKEMGYEYTHEILPWARALEGLKLGIYDVIPNTWYTEDRATYLYFSDYYAINEVRFIKRIGDPFEYFGIESLKDKKIGIVNGYGYNDEFLNSQDFERVPLPTAVQNIKSLLSGRIDLTLEDPIVITAFIIAEEPSLLDQIEFTKNTYGTNKMYVSSGKANPRSEEYIKAFNDGLAKIKENGVFDEIMSRYDYKFKKSN